MMTLPISVRTPVATAVGVLVLCASVSVQATTVLKVDVPEMVRLSEWVVLAHVTAIIPNDRTALGDRVYTDFALAIDEVYAGSKVPKIYTLSLMGGLRDDGLAVHVPGMPRLKVGQTVVLFLEKTTRGHVLCGMGQGVWQVETTESGAQWVTQSTGHVNLMARTPEGRIVSAQAVPTRRRRLETLVAELKAAKVLQMMLPAPAILRQ
ncbi:MAG: hypothetical protein ACI9MR_003894 [Myxococcota bacterium]|jgi:hypothetical protein